MTPNQIAFAVLAAIFVLVFVLTLLNYKRQCGIITNCTEKIAAKVVAVELLSATSNGPVYYTPTVEYEVNGKVVKVNPFMNLSAKDVYEEGQDIDIMFDPKKINRCYIAGKFTTSKITTCIFGLLAVAFIGCFISTFF